MTAPFDIPETVVKTAAQAIAETFNEAAGALALGDPEGSGSVAADWMQEARAALEAAAPAMREQWGADLERFADEAGISDDFHLLDNSEGARRIAVERTRQIEDEGYTAEHDGAYHGGPMAGSLATAGAAYALSASGSVLAGQLWPWRDGWKPKGGIADLVRAGALIAAEIDRLIARGVDR